MGLLFPLFALFQMSHERSTADQHGNTQLVANETFMLIVTINHMFLLLQ